MGAAVHAKTLPPRNRLPRCQVRSPDTKTTPMLMIVICFLAPWLAMFLRGKVVQGILCILLHLTLIGWIPATTWANLVTRREATA